MQFQKESVVWSKRQLDYAEHDDFVLVVLVAASHFTVYVSTVELSGAVADDIVFDLFLIVGDNLTFHVCYQSK